MCPSCRSGRSSSSKTRARFWPKAGTNRRSIPTWHGEMVAINHLAQRGLEIGVRRLTLYTTAEPCPMCQSAILWSGIETVVYGASIKFLQSQGWRQIDILAAEVVGRSPTWQCTLIGGVLERECNALFLAATQSRDS